MGLYQFLVSLVAVPSLTLLDLQLTEVSEIILKMDLFFCALGNPTPALTPYWLFERNLLCCLIIQALHYI
jgi:xanthine/uracil permease